MTKQLRKLTTKKQRLVQCERKGPKVSETPETSSVCSFQSSDASPAVLMVLLAICTCLLLVYVCLILFASFVLADALYVLLRFPMYLASSLYAHIERVVAYFWPLEGN